MNFKIRLLILRYSLMLCLILGFTAQSVFAQGRIVIEPIIETSMWTDSNFYKSENNELRVNTYSVKPGVKLGYTTDKSLVSLDYVANILRYDDKDTMPVGQLDTDEFDYVGHRALFRAQTQTTEHLLLGLDNLFIKSRDPASAETNSNAVDRYKYTMNNFSPRLLYNFGEKFGLGLKYTNLMTDYSSDVVVPGEAEDSDENRGTFTLFYYLNPATFFDLDYQIWNRDYDETSSDYDSDQVMVSVNHQFNYFTVSAGAGYHQRDFDQTVASGDIDRFIWKFSIAGQNLPGAVGIPKSSMYMDISSNLNDSGSGDDYYNAIRFNARFTYLFLEKINCNLSGWFQNSDYETSDREDDRWLLSAGADYLLNDFFTLGLEGGMEDRDSNETGRDFDNKYFMFNIKFTPNLSAK